MTVYRHQAITVIALVLQVQVPVRVVSKFEVTGMILPAKAVEGLGWGWMSYKRKITKVAEAVYALSLT